jgi:hypothetical protein
MDAQTWLHRSSFSSMPAKNDLAHGSPRLVLISQGTEKLTNTLQLVYKITCKMFTVKDKTVMHWCQVQELSKSRHLDQPVKSPQRCECQHTPQLAVLSGNALWNSRSNNRYIYRCVNREFGWKQILDRYKLHHFVILFCARKQLHQNNFQQWGTRRVHHRRGNIERGWFEKVRTLQKFFSR